MYRCLQCGTKFSIPTIDHEYIGKYHGQPVAENYYICPCCGSAELKEINLSKCHVCGRDHTGDDYYCDTCITFTATAIARAMWTSFRGDAPPDVLCDMAERVVCNHMDEILEELEKHYDIT